MISLTDFKTSLGDYADTLTDQEIERLMLDMYQFAEITYEVWLKENKNNLLKVNSDV